MSHFAPNPIFPGWCSDPSILRVGKDYYIAASTFEWMPGVNLYHSLDMKHWEQLPSPLTDELLDQEGLEASCCIWAPNLTWSDGLFYLAYTVVYTSAHRFKDTWNYIITAKDIRGPWSEPVFVNCIGFDPSVFHDDDGRKYIVNQTMERRKAFRRFRGVSVTELDPVTLKPLGLSRVVFPGTDRGTTEGPNIMKKDGWYYITAAEGGTEYGHCVTIARSRNLWGPYEVDPENPMLSSTGTACVLQRAGHGQFVSDPEGNWYMAHLCSRPLEGRWSVMGRECAIQNVTWPEGEWPRIADAQGHPVPHAQPALSFRTPDAEETVWPAEPVRTVFAEGIPLSFMTLRRCWPRRGISLNAREGWMRITGGQSLCSHFDQHLLARRVTALRLRAETLMEFRPECANHTAGLVVMYNSVNWHYLFLSADDDGRPVAGVSTCENGELTDQAEIALPEGCASCRLGAELSGAALRFFLQADGVPRQQVGPALDMRILSDEHVQGNGFTSAMIGVCCQDLQGNGCFADFAWFDYEPLD
ncbi:MAG: family 43 glycosylhydrolase [Aristaeellaceae bacterium]